MDMIIRAFQERDAESITALFQLVYGGRYVYPDIYHPAMICYRNTQGYWHGAVAELHDSIVGHAALLPCPGKEKIAELAMCVVHPSVRNRGVVTSLGKYLCRKADKLGLDTLTMKMVSSHTYTQRLAKALGFHSTALLRDYVFSPFEPEGRESVILGVLPLQPRPVPLSVLDYQHDGWPALLAEKFGVTQQLTPGTRSIPAVKRVVSEERLDITLTNLSLATLSEIALLPINRVIYLYVRIDAASFSLLPYLYRDGYRDMGLAPAENGQWFWLLERGYTPKKLEMCCPIASALQEGNI
ncbi:GNAT family N-acetyltransferase [[Pantoea] beijingensis]|uniref:GNAT family N-acetyltransferase n=1 Tax=[Pantoea] beijingensis TaxID=1324864 RepID=UPI001F3AEBBA|nr:GNAT family N-acetyltransferase [[Pantoea] beijingensis]